MAAYPTFPQGIETRAYPKDDITVLRATNGAARGRAWYTNKKYDFPAVVHRALTKAETATVEAFYDANRNVPFTFTWQQDGVVRTCIFTGPPRIEPLEVMLAGAVGGNRVTTSLTEV
jgi:hypothetical protein